MLPFVLALAQVRCGAAPTEREDDLRSDRASLLVVGPESKLVASDGAAADMFGRDVAIAGNTMAIGVPADDLGSSTSSGSVRVLVRSGTSWVSEATLTHASSRSFGYSVAIDGDTTLAGAPSSEVQGTLYAGKAAVFVRAAGVWSESAFFIGAGTLNEGFGEAVALDGDTAVVGAPGRNVSRGAVEVLQRVGSKWTLGGSLPVGVLQIADRFGCSVGVSGSTAIVGASGTSTGAGAAYVFSRSGATWSQQAKLVPTSAAGGGSFGDAVALHGDTAFVGAKYANTAGYSAGAVYVFERSGTVWTQKTILTASDATPNALFGHSLDIRNDRALVGAWLDGSSGGAYLFQRTNGVWSQQVKLKASDPASLDHFGQSVALGEDAAVVGAYLDDNAGGTDAGAAYVYSVQASQGTVCSVPTACVSGFCVDGVCCDTACGASQSDCQACSVAAGATVDGTCAIASASTVCRAAAGACDVAEKCDGLAATCPADVYNSSGTACDDGKKCTGADVCSGAGTCSGVAIDCDDQNECTTDVCDEQTGCSNPSKADGTACSGGECVGGKCAPVGSGGSGGTAGQAGSSSGGLGGSTGGQLAGGTGSSGGLGGAGGAGGGGKGAESGDGGGCGCRLGRPLPVEPGLVAWLSLAFIAHVRRRRALESSARLSE